MKLSVVDGNICADKLGIVVDKPVDSVNNYMNILGYCAEITE